MSVKHNSWSKLGPEPGTQKVQKLLLGVPGWLSQ